LSKKEEADNERESRGDEPSHGLDADAPDRRGVAHVRDPHDQGGEHQRRDDHLDEAQEDVGEQRDVAGGGLRHLGCGQELVAHAADQYAEHHACENPRGQFHVRTPLVCR